MSGKEADADDFSFSFKVVVLGDSSSGTSALLEGEGATPHGTDVDASGGLGFSVKMYEREGTTYRVQYWVCPGADRYVKMTSRLTAGAAGAIFVFNVNDRFSFDRLGYWVTEVERTSRFVSVLVGNTTREDGSSDDAEREVSPEMAEEFASKYGMTYIEVDSNSGLGVEDVFQHMLGQVAKVIPDPAEPSMLLRTGIKIGKKLLLDRRYKRSLFSGATAVDEAER